MSTTSLVNPISTFKENEVLLGNVRLPIRGRIQLVKATQHPGKISIGKITRADQVLADEWIQNDWREGMLIYYLDETLHTGRFFWSTADTRWLKKMMLPPLVVSIGNPTATLTPADTLTTFNGAVYASFGGKVYKWDDTNQTWGSLLHDIGALPTDAIAWNGKLYYALGGAGYVQFDPTGPTWTSYVTPTVQYFCEFDVNPNQKLIEIDGAGLIQASIDGVAWTNQVGGKITDPTTVTGLVSYRDAADNPSLFVATTTGLYDIDVWTQTVYKTALKVLNSPTNGKKLTVWSDGSLYFPAGLSIWRYPKSGDIQNVGMDRDEGLPTFIRGRVTNLVYHPTYLIAVVDATTQVGLQSTTDPLYLQPYWEMANFNPTDASGFSAIMAFNSTGWHNIYLSQFSGTGIPSALMDTSYNNNERRLFFCDGKIVKYMTLPEGNYNPALDPNATFAQSGTFTTAWFDGGYTEIIKLAISMKVRALNITATETIQVYYAINDQTNFNLLGTVSSATVDSGGRALFYFNLPSGIQFYNIQFQFQFARGTNVHTSPEMLFFDLRFKRLPAVLWGWTFTVVGNDQDHLQSQWQQIKAMCEARLTYQFAFSAASDTTIQPVEIVGVTGIQFGGSDNTSYFTVTVIELEKG